MENTDFEKFSGGSNAEEALLILGLRILTREEIQKILEESRAISDEQKNLKTLYRSQREEIVSQIKESTQKLNSLQEESKKDLFVRFSFTLGIGNTRKIFKQLPKMFEKLNTLEKTFYQKESELKKQYFELNESMRVNLKKLEELLLADNSGPNTKEQLEVIKKIVAIMPPDLTRDFNDLFPPFEDLQDPKDREDD